MTQAWDLTRDISPYLDPHMILPLLQYLEDLLDEGVSSYKKADVTRARLALVQPTKMVNYAAEIAQSLNESVGDVQKEKDAVFQELESLKSKCKTLDKLCTTERVSCLALEDDSADTLNSQRSRLPINGM